MTHENITALIGKENENLLTHTCKTVTKDLLHLPSSTFIDDVISLSNRSNQTLCSLGSIYNHGRLANTGYLSILPVDQGVEHSAGASFVPSPIMATNLPSACSSLI